MAPINFKDSSERGKGCRSSSSARGHEIPGTVRPRHASQNWHNPGYRFPTSRSASGNSSSNSSFSSSETSVESHYRPRRMNRGGMKSSNNGSVSHRSHFRAASATATVTTLPNDAPPPFETDPAALARRQKQIDYGKNTLEYEAYSTQVPRGTRTRAQPKTPDRTLKCSRRNWDAQVKIWRLLLHAYNPANRLVKSENVEIMETKTKKEEDGAEMSLYFCPMETDSEKGSGSTSKSSTPGKSDRPEN